MHLKFEYLPRSTLKSYLSGNIFSIFCWGLRWSCHLCCMLLRWRIFNYSWRSYVAHGDLWRRRSEKHFGVEMMDYILICDDFDWCCKNLHTFVLHDVIVSINLIDIKNRFVSSKTTQLRKDADICAMGRVVHWIEISPVNTLVSQEFPPLQLPVPHFRWHAQAIEGFVKSSGGDYFFSNLVYCRLMIFSQT